MTVASEYAGTVAQLRQRIQSNKGKLRNRRKRMANLRFDIDSLRAQISRDQASIEAFGGKVQR